MGWEPKRKPRIDWRAFLTAEEEMFVSESDRHLREAKRLAAGRALIINRAIHRAKYAAAKPIPKEQPDHE